MTKKPTKFEILGAATAINGQLDLINDIARTEGAREARANAMYGDTVQRMRGAITTLNLAHVALPDKLQRGMTLAKQFGWV